MGKKSKQAQNDKSNKHKAGLKTLERLIQDEVEQLSQRHEATLKRLLLLERRLDEQLEQLSQRHEAVLKRLLELERRARE